MSKETTNEMTVVLDGKPVVFVRKDLVQYPSVDIKYVGPYQIGKNYVIRRVTMINVGTLVYMDDKFMVLSNASWIADTGRYSEFLSGKCVANDIEKYTNDCIINHGAIMDSTEYMGELPTKTK